MAEDGVTRNGHTRLSRRNVPQVVKNEIAKFLIESPDYSGAELKRLVESSLRARGIRYCYTARTYQTWKRKSGPVLSDLDKEWSLGTLREYPVLPDVLDCVTTLQRLFHAQRPRPKWLTIRRVQWVAVLHPVLWPLLSEYPTRLAQIAAFYSRREQVAEVNNDPYPVTTDLDKVFLEDRDVSAATVTRVWVDTYGGRQVEPFGWETGLLLDFVKRLLEKGADKAIEFADAHSEVWPEAEAWMVFQVRGEAIQ